MEAFFSLLKYPSKVSDMFCVFVCRHFSLLRVMLTCLHFTLNIMQFEKLINAFIMTLKYKTKLNAGLALRQSADLL